jgi:hypothetical protein
LLTAVLMGLGFPCQSPPSVRQYNEMASRRKTHPRTGLASLDYVLILGVVLPLVTLVMWAGPRIMRLAYEMVCVLVSWPFM